MARGFSPGTGTAAVAVAAAVALSACGQGAPDLFAVKRSGADRAANLQLVVSDGGTVTCNGGDPKGLSGDQLLTARELSRELNEAATLGLRLPAGKGTVLSYEARVENGTVSFSDTSRQKPASFDRLAGFVDDVAENVCQIRR